MSKESQMEKAHAANNGVRDALRKTHTYKVLDHGYVQLIDFMGDDLTPLEAARLSTDNPTGEDEKKDNNLRNFLWRMQHTSPSEQNELVVELQVPIFVLRQIDRHRTLDISNGQFYEDYDEFRKWTNRNEFSGRYAEMPDLYYIPELSRIQPKDAKNKQGSSGSLNKDSQERVQGAIKASTRQSREAYEEVLDHGVASEIARLVLPMNQYTRIRLKASMLHWMKRFLELRLDEHAQKEVRWYAQAIGRIIKSLWPRCWDVFEKHTLYSVTLSKKERSVIAFFLMDLRDGEVTHMDGLDETLARYATDQGLSQSRADELANKLFNSDRDLLAIE